MKIGEIDFRISFSRFKMDFILYYAKEGYCYNENLLDNIFFFFQKMLQSILKLPAIYFHSTESRHCYVLTDALVGLLIEM